MGKEIKELKIEELTLDQKLGMSMIGFCSGNGAFGDPDYMEELIRNRSLGGVWISPQGNYKTLIKRFKDAADYPLLFFTDAENGWGDYKIGRQNVIGMTGSEELAYTFGKVTAIGARLDGYNVVCNPVLDMTNSRGLCGANIRSLGGDKEKVSRLAAAEARGMRDAGVLSVAKHYPGSSRKSTEIDSHMAEVAMPDTAEELLSYALYPYLELMKEDLIDGVMLRHSRYENIDPDYPASLSSKLIKLIRDRGFDGFAMTDALNMMGVVAKFGRKGSVGLAVGNAGAFALPFSKTTREAMNWLRESYAEGVITDEKLDEVVRDVLKAQHKAAMIEAKYTEITEEDIKNLKRINKESIFAKCDDGVPVALDREAQHCFAILTETDFAVMDRNKVAVDTMQTHWYHPLRIEERLKELFPNSKVVFISEYPTPNNVSIFLSDTLDCGDVVFISFLNSNCYAGKECLTPRIISMLEAMQVTERISTFVHFGNPYVAEDLPHASRVIIGSASSASVEAGLDVLAGNYPAMGVLTYDIKLK